MGCPKGRCAWSTSCCIEKSPVAGLEACAKENEGVDPAGASESEVLPKEAPVEGNKLGEADGALENPPKDAVEADAVPSPAGVEVGADDPNRPPLEGVPNVNPLAAGEGVAPNVFVEMQREPQKGLQHQQLKTCQRTEVH